jgi:soluble lytic murein transglycosylase-like protein
MLAVAVFTPTAQASAPAPTAAETQALVVEEVKELTVQEKVDLYADKYGVSRKEMHATIKCESGYRQSAYNKTDPQGGAIGIGQFLRPTFNAYAPKAGIENPDIHDVDHQLQTMAYMFSIGEKSQWTCWRDLYL